MKKKVNIRTVIREIVREEVQMALQKELTEVFKSLKTKPITETKRQVVKKRKQQKGHVGMGWVCTISDIYYLLFLMFRLCAVFRNSSI